MTKMLHLDDRLIPCEGVDVRDVEGNSVLFNIVTGKYFGLEGVGADIWQSVDQGLTLAEIAETLAQSYEVPLADCQKDVLKFAQRLRDAKLVEVA